ncbi:TrkH family potassium uptake protein [Tianweitania sediminis]|uniref:Trk system potassium uptake protein n=1 Tax=Tianweitania sediminis TaxID=1502156 RepID=A0A8J7UL21_9HYPH|nr:TrkH family potassium uptake protein [Tianweitania sediminis]MBP0440279.1 TrkH family potassium uptake protein [Tianweitania sediminis]
MQSLAVRSAVHAAGIFGLYLSGTMLLPAAVDLYYGNEDWKVFAFSAFLTGGFSLAVALATQSSAPSVSPRFGFLLVNLLWGTAALAGSVPFLLSSLEMGLTDAIFESVSGITTTGGTVITGLDSAPPGILFWRSLIQWMGGIGVIALGLFILPYLNIGGVTYFKIESSDIEDRPFERLTTFTVALLTIYSLLTLTCAVSYAAAGMTGFDAINHAMSTVSTAGFSTHDASFGRYGDNYAVLWTAIVFMTIAALPSSILILFAIRGRTEAIRDPQIRVFLGYTIVLSLGVTVYLRTIDGVDFWEALTHSTFNFVSVITTTGFASDDYNLWGPFAIACFFVASFLGGCSGSTSGGIKAYRFFILYRLMANGLRRLIYPNVVLPVRYGDRPVDDVMQRSVVLFICAFMMIWLLGSVLLAATGLDLTTATTATVGALANVGPGLGDIVGPAGNYTTFPDAAKWVLSLAMLFGRLEILAVLVIFTPGFWGR